MYSRELLVLDGARFVNMNSSLNLEAIDLRRKHLKSGGVLIMQLGLPGGLSENFVDCSKTLFRRNGSASCFLIESTTLIDLRLILTVRAGCIAKFPQEGNLYKFSDPTPP